MDPIDMSCKPCCGENSSSSGGPCCEGRNSWPDSIFGEYTFNCEECTFDATSPLEFTIVSPGLLEYEWNQEDQISCGGSLGFAVFQLFCEDGVLKLRTIAFGRTNIDTVTVISCNPFHATVDATLQWPVPGEPDGTCTMTIEFTE